METPSLVQFGLWTTLAIFAASPSDAYCDPDGPLNFTERLVPTVTYVPVEVFLEIRSEPQNAQAARELILRLLPYANDPDYYERSFDPSDPEQTALPIDFTRTDPFDLSKIHQTLSRSGLFECVEFGVAEYGGMFQTMVIPKKNFPYQNKDEFKAVVSEMAREFITGFMCKEGCAFKELATGSSVYKVYMIEGRGRDMFLQTPQSWERYKISFQFYESGWDDEDTIDVITQFTSGWRAPYREDSRPPTDATSPWTTTF